MPKEKIILTDADGCLVDWNNAFNAFMTNRGHPPLPNSEHEYNLSLRHNIAPRIAGALIREFNKGPMVAELSPFADSIEYVARLSDLGFKFIVVTSISHAPIAKYYRTKNLHNLFGSHVFSEINCIEMGASKATILQNWAGTNYFWIEDHMRQAEAGHEAGLKTVLISHPYNSHYETDLFPKVSNETPWKEIHDMVRTEYGI